MTPAEKRHEAHQAEYAAKLAKAQAHAAAHPLSEEDEALAARTISAINKALNS